VIGSLFRERYRPRFGTPEWARYWAKRARLLPALLSAEWRSRRFERGCSFFGKRTIVAPTTVFGRLDNLSIGDDCAIGQVEIHLAGRVSIGDCVVINDHCRLLSASHDVHSPDWQLVAETIMIEDYVWIATGAMILPGLTIGRGAVIGAGAVVCKDVDEMAIMVGNPARPVGSRRATHFSYRPSASSALFEAWLGPAETPAIRELMEIGR
jgi:maltose O-acetyltransferase